MTDDMLLTELDEHGVFTLTINRPKANAFNTELIHATTKAMKKASKDDAVRVVLLQAEGHIFSAGQDITEFATGGERTSFREHLQHTYNPLILAMRKLEKPILCAVNGAVAGAAFGIVLAADLRIASEAAQFFVGFSGIGLAPDSAVSLMLPTIIGLGRAAEAAYFNEPINAEQAHAWGLVNKLVGGDALRNESYAWAKRLADGPVQAMGYTKRAFNKAIIPHLEETLDYEGHIQEVAGGGADHIEGVAAFLEKREANFRG